VASPRGRAANLLDVRFFYDCEFIEDGTTIDLVSIGAVGEDGREFYAVSTEFDPSRAGTWVRANVLPKLPSPADPAWRSRVRLREDLLAFLTGADGDVELWGAMPALPRPLPRFTRELRQRWEDSGRPTLPNPTSDAHDALADARLNLRRWQAIESAVVAR
jgi:hypothetical protein